MSTGWYSKRLWIRFMEKTQFIVSGLTACFQLYTRSSSVAYFIVGALACSLSVKAVKRMIRQPRPVGKSKKTTFGMPSTHSATITYYASYISAACLTLPLHKSLRFITRNASMNLTTAVPFLVLPWASLVVLSRVWLGHHTWQQVAVGSGYGAVFAGLWFTLWTRGGVNVLGEQIENLATEYVERLA